MRKVVLATVMATFCFSSVIASTEYKPIIIDNNCLREIWAKETTAPIKYISDEHVVYCYYNHPPEYARDITLHCPDIETGNDIWTYSSVRHDRLLKYNRYEDIIIAEVMPDEKSYAFSYVALDINNGEEVWRSENEYSCDGNSGSGIYQVVNNSMYFIDLELYSDPGYYYKLFLVSVDITNGKELYRYELCTSDLAIDHDPCGYLSDVSGDLQLWIPTIKFRNLLLFDSKKMKVSQIDGTNESYSSRSNTYRG